MTSATAAPDDAHLKEGGFFAPARAIGALIAAQLLVWTLFPFLLATSMDVDVVADGMSWGHEWQLGYYKHPPLPSWLVEIFFNTLGDIGPFLLSQIAVALTYLFVYWLGRELMDARKAAAGTLLLAAVYYFSIPTPMWNHNVAQMPVWAALCFLYWKAHNGRDLRWWLGFGIVAGLGMLTKYSTAMLLAALALHYLVTPDWRARLRNPGPYVALVAMIVVLLPHLWWLAHTGFPTLSYAQAQAGHAKGVFGWIVAPPRFLISQILDCAPAILIAAIAGFFGRGAGREFLRASSDADRFLWIAGVGPAVLTALVSLFTGLGANAMWGAPMCNLAGLILVRLAAERWERVSFQRIAIGVAVCFVVFPVCYLLTTVIGPHLRGFSSRMEWPERQMAAELNAEWTRDTHMPLRIVSGESWIVGLVAMRPPRPSVFTEANFRKSPWITPERLHRDGALLVWDEAAHVPINVAALAQGAKLHGTKQFAWPLDSTLKPLRIGWAILPPQNEAQP